MNGKILIIGSTGTVGRPLVAELANTGEAVRAASRDPAAARARGDFAGTAEIVAFDLEDPATFDAALDGVDRVFLISRPGDNQADRLAFPFIETMERHGIRHVVDLSAMGAEVRPELAVRRIEQRLEASSLSATHLRPNFFMQLFTRDSLLAAIRSGVIRVPAAMARISWIDARDIADVAAGVLVSPRAHAGKAYTLTGDEALDHAAIAKNIREASGIDVHYEAITEEESRHVLAEAGFPPPWVERLIGFYRLVRHGFTASTTTDVRELLGRPARTFAAFAREHAAVWRHAG